MLEIVKIENGLNWNSSDKIHTFEYFESGYEITDDNHISIELNNQIYCLGADSVTIDGQNCLNSSDLIFKIFGGN